MIKKSFVIFFGLLSIYAGYSLNNIEIMEGFERPLMYKITYMGFKIIGYIAQMCDRIGIATEYATYRNLIELISFSEIDRSDQSVKVEHKKINNLNVRVYTPNSKNEKQFPVMVYIHGGAYIFGNLDGFDLFLYKIAQLSNIIVITIDYRLAPEYPYPTPTNDCMSVIEYILNNTEEFNINPNKLIIGGDSAGGNGALVLSQNLAKQNKTKPILQVLIYPWAQMATFHLPSSFNYQGGIISTLSFSKIVSWYLGITNYTDEMEEALRYKEHHLLLPESERQKLNSYLDVSQIPEEYKVKKSYYKKFEDLKPIKTNGKLEKSSILLNNKDFADRTKLAFTSGVSPSLADLEELKNYPKTYQITCEWDGLKDDGLILAERLKKAGVEVKLKFYEKCFHAMVPLIDYKVGYKYSFEILNDLTNFIKMNV